MGLAEKRAIKEVEDNSLKGSTEEIKSLIGADIEVTVEWDTFSTEGAISDLGNTGLSRLIEGLTKVCKDEMGKEALAETLKTINFKYVAGSDKKLDFTDGVYTIAGGWGDSLSDIFTGYDIGDFLENNL